MTLKRIFEVDVTDDHFEERRVIMLKSMLRMKEKENILLRQMLKLKEDTFLKCSELCAFFSQILSNEYLEKRKKKEGEPLGISL